MPHVQTPDPLYQAAETILTHIASEWGGCACLSGDIVASTADGEPIVSVIHLDDRRHWNLTVATKGTWPTSVPVAISSLADALLGDLSDGVVLLVVTPAGAWQVRVEVLEPAAI